MFVSRQAAVQPRNGAACGCKPCKATTWVCHIDCLFIFCYAKHVVLQQVAIGRLQATCWPAIIYINPSAHLFMLEDWVSPMNMSVRQFPNFDKVVLHVHLQLHPFIM